MLTHLVTSLGAVFWMVERIGLATRAEVVNSEKCSSVCTKSVASRGCGCVVWSLVNVSRICDYQTNNIVYAQRNFI